MHLKIHTCSVPAYFEVYKQYLDFDLLKKKNQFFEADDDDGDDDNEETEKEMEDRSCHNQRGTAKL